MKYSKEIREEIVKQRKKGFSYNEIKETLKVPYYLVQQICQENGLNSGTISARKYKYEKPEVYTDGLLSKATKDKVRDRYYSKSILTKGVLDNYVVNEIHREYTQVPTFKRKRPR